ncbi:MAG: hypothetical protein HOY78_38835 [Saccharothrix sp.]|nr:hypothetical protein [Saccharothrix sp.]
MSDLWLVRDLVLGLRDAADGWGADEVGAWFEREPDLLGELQAVGRPEARGDRDAELLWGLYAVSRLVDLLTAPHQPGDRALGWPMPSAGAWDGVRALVGAVEVAEDGFHPFFHEIVRVEPADDPDEPVSLVAEHWPGALVGGLLLARAGVTVRAGGNVLDPAVATRSTQYWTWWRRNRPVDDLSHGWGSNSQWRTEFRRDYVVGDEVHFNVDGRESRPPEPDDDLTDAERLELLRFRHGVRRDLGPDRWPYGETLVEARP